MKPGNLDLSALKEKEGNLPEEVEEQIRQSVIDERLTGDKPKNTDDDDDTDEETDPDEDTSDNEEEDDTGESEEDRKARETKEAEEAEAKTAEEEAAAKQKLVDDAKAKDEAERTEEEKTLLKEAEEAEKAQKTEKFEQEVQEYASKNGITEEAARKDVEKIQVVREKYKNDPTEMSRALYHLTKKLSQVTTELSSIKTAPKPGQVKINGKLLSVEETRELLIKNYREQFPEVSEDLSDEKVHALAEKELTERIRVATEKKVQQDKANAENRRAELLTTLPEQDKAFAKDVAGVLARVADSEVLDEDFDISDYVNWARGKNYHRDIKAAVEKAVKEAREEKKILGKKPEGASGGGQTPTTKKESASASLTAEEKERALEMFSSLNVPDEEKYKYFLEDHKNRKPNTAKKPVKR